MKENERYEETLDGAKRRGDVMLAERDALKLQSNAIEDEIERIRQDSNNTHQRMDTLLSEKNGTCT